MRHRANIGRLLSGTEKRFERKKPPERREGGAMSGVRTLNIGLCGLGTVGQGVWKHFGRSRPDLEARLGARSSSAARRCADLRKARGVRVPASKLTTDAAGRGHATPGSTSSAS